jgi:hypothetical protein
LLERPVEGVRAFTREEIDPRTLGLIEEFVDEPPADSPGSPVRANEDHGELRANLAIRQQLCQSDHLAILHGYDRSNAWSAEALQVRCGSVTKHGQPSFSKRAITAPRCSRAILMYSMSAVSHEVGWIRVESCKQARPYLAVPVEARVRKAPTRGEGFAHRQGQCSRSYYISCQGDWSHGGC